MSKRDVVNHQLEEDENDQDRHPKMRMTSTFGVVYGEDKFNRTANNLE